MNKSSSLGMPMSPQEIFKRYKHQSLGTPKASPSSSTKYQVIFQCAIFLLLHILCDVLGASFIFVFSLFCFVCCNKLGCILAFLCGRETHSVLIAQNTRKTIRMETRVFFAIKMECVCSKTNICWDPTIQYRKQKKIKQKTKTKTLQE